MRTIAGPLLALALLATVLPLTLDAQLRARRRGATEESRRPIEGPIPGVARTLEDQAYGSNAAQRYDVHLPANARNAPVIVMVHGGGWRRGDKALGGVVREKAARWVPKGFIVASVNYPMVPEQRAAAQGDDVARAIGEIQRRAPEWGGDPRRTILMGHSAGAHLVLLVTSAPQLLASRVAHQPVATVALDGAAYDVEEMMTGATGRIRLYRDAFGSDPAEWKRASPLAQLSTRVAPTMLVCSTQRRRACDEGEQWARKSGSLGGRATVLPQDLSHAEVNHRLGQDGEYTRRVEEFLKTTDARVAELLR